MKQILTVETSQKDSSEYIFYQLSKDRNLIKQKMRTVDTCLTWSDFHKTFEFHLLKFSSAMASVNYNIMYDK